MPSSVGVVISAPHVAPPSNTGGTISGGGGGVPAGALLTEDGQPLLDESGNYLLVE